MRFTLGVWKFSSNGTEVKITIVGALCFPSTALNAMVLSGGTCSPQGRLDNV